MKTPKRHLLSLAFAVVFLPPRKEIEDWSAAFPLKDIPKESFEEKVATAESPKNSEVAKDRAFTSRFTFNGIDKVGFAPNRGEKLHWELTLPPVDFYQIWETGAWSGLSLGARELNHFYVRQQKRGPEPKHRAYSLAADWELVDSGFCSKREMLLLEKTLFQKDKKTRYRLTLVKLLSSQELKREGAWQFEAETGQEFLYLKNNLKNNLKNSICSSVDLEGWPKSFRVKL